MPSSSLLTESALLDELAEVVEREVARHLALSREWYPHDFIPWSRGRDFSSLGGTDWEPGQSRLDEVAQTAIVMNLLTEDNLPSYHHMVLDVARRDGPWGHWIGRWTAEEARHSIVLRDYLLVTRSVDPVQLEQIRMEHMTTGVSFGQHGYRNIGDDDESGSTAIGLRPGILPMMVYTSIQELATRISHANTAGLCEDPVAKRIMQRLAADENLHMLFYRQMVSSALELAPNQTMRAISQTVRNFSMPGVAMPEFRRRAIALANAGVYNPEIHLNAVLLPLLRAWGVLSLSNLTADGAQAQDELGRYIETLERRVRRRRDRGHFAIQAE